MRSASWLSASPTPWPRAPSSTTTSSIHARTPVGMRKTINVRDPTISPSTRATSRCDAGDVAISLSCSAEGAGADLDSCGISLANASTISGVTALQTVTDTVIAWEVNAYTPATYVLPGGFMHDEEVRAKARKLRDLVEVVAASVYFLIEAH